MTVASRPKASIIITTHNRPHLLPRAIESALAAGTNIEIIVVDDASADETSQVCQTFENIKYVRIDRNQGTSGARNVGLVASQGNYLTFLDDDDTRMPSSLDLQVEMLEREPAAGLIYGRALIADRLDRQSIKLYPSECLGGDVFWSLLTRNFIPCGSAVFRRVCLTRVGLLGNDIRGFDDWDLWIRISEIYPIIVTLGPVTIWTRPTPTSGQGSSDAAALVSGAVRQFRQVWLNLPRAAQASHEVRRLAWLRFSETMAKHLIWESVRALRSRKLLPPLKNLSIILRLQGFTVIRIAWQKFLRYSTNGTLSRLI